MIFFLTGLRLRPFKVSQEDRDANMRSPGGPMESIHDAVGLEKLRGQGRIEPNVLRQLRNAFYKKQQTAAEVVLLLPEAQRATFGDEVRFHALELCHQHDSRLDGASKLIYRTAGGHL